DVAPDGWRRPLRARQTADQTRMRRIRHVDERGAIAARDERVVAPRLGVRPAPHVVDPHAALTTQLVDRDVCDELDVRARELAHAALPAARARREAAPDPVDDPLELLRVAPLAARPRQCDCAPLAE